MREKDFHYVDMKDMHALGHKTRQNLEQSFRILPHFVTPLVRWNIPILPTRICLFVSAYNANHLHV